MGRTSTNTNTQFDPTQVSEVRADETTCIIIGNRHLNIFYPALRSVESSAPETQSELMSRFFRSQNGNLSAPPSPTSTSRDPSTTAPTSGTTTPRSMLPQSEDPVSDAIR